MRGNTAIICVWLLMLAGSAIASADDITEFRFQDQRQAVKIVVGDEGSDMGDYAGKGSSLIAHLLDLGVNLTRVGIAWADCEKVRGQEYDWTIPDQMINSLADRGIEPMVVLFSCPEWARRTHPDDERREIELGIPYTGLQMPLPSYERDYARWAEAVAKRYKGRVRYYEFWNEPDGIPGPILIRDKSGLLIDGHTGGDPVMYARWLKVAHDGIKKGNPDAKIAAGSLSVSDTNFMEAIYATVGKDAFDAISYHPYLRAGINEYWLRQLRQLSIRYGHPGCEQWITEYDWTPRDNRGGLTATYGCGRAAEVLESDGVKICARYPFVTQLYLHTLNDWGDPVGYLPSEGFGLLTMDMKKKPKYEEYRESLLWWRERSARNAAIQGPEIVFAGESFSINIDPILADDVGMLKWYVPDGWVIKPSAKSGYSYVVQSPADAASCDPTAGSAPGRAMGGDTYPISAVNGRGYTFTHYVEVIEPLQLANVTMRAGVKSESRAVAEALIYNLDDESREGELKFDLPAGWNMVGRAYCTVRANGYIKKSVEFSASPQTLPGIYEATAHLIYAGRECGRYKFCLAKEVQAPLSKVKRTVDGDLSDWTDAKWTQIPGDASSSEFAAGWDKDFFYLAVRVHDSIHVASKSIRDAWLEDSIQLGIDPLCNAVPGGKPTGDDCEMTLALTDGGLEHYRYTCPLDSYGGSIQGLQFVAKRAENLTTYEMAMPWAELEPLHPEAGKSMGLSVVVNDSDGEQRKTSSWGDGVVRAKLPINHGRVWLSE